MKRLKITILFPFEGTRTFPAMPESEAMELYNKAREIYAGEPVRVELIDA